MILTQNRVGSVFAPTLVEPRQFKAGLHDSMREPQILEMKVVDALTENLRFLIGFNTET